MDESVDEELRQLKARVKNGAEGSGPTRPSEDQNRWRMPSYPAIVAPAVLFLIFVAPIWVIMHYPLQKPTPSGR